MLRQIQRSMGLIAVSIAMVLGGCTYPLENKQASVPEVAGHTLPDERVKAAIMAAGKQTPVQWDMVEVKPGLIRANLNFKNKHKITLDIPYSASSYELVYVDSQMMRYEPPSSSGGTARIGSHYIEWVNELDEQIKANLRAVVAVAS